MTRNVGLLWAAGLVAAVLGDGISRAEERPASTVVGWRGDGTGRYPGATPPTVWGRWPKSPIRGLRSQAGKPQGEPGAGSRPLEYGLIRDWLVLGPFAAGEKPLDQEFVPGEAELRPDENEKVGDLAWKPALMKREGEDFGNVSMDWLRLGEVLTPKSQAAYAHVYLYSQSDGKVVFVFDHQGATKVWVNGKGVYSNPKGSVSLYAMNNISWAISVYRPLAFEIAARRIPVDLVKGWNRVLFKITGTVHLRLAPDPATEYEEKNIAWVTKLPERSNASPIIVGDRLLVCSEPDELICVNKQDGRILWRRPNSFFDATSEAEKQENPILKNQVAPLAEKLKAAETYAEKLALRKQIADLLVRADKNKYEMRVEDHPVSHWPIAGWTTPTPISDGRHVYVWFSSAVAACYDLEGNRTWIQRVDLLIRDPKAKHGPYRYPCSPQLAGGRIVLGIPGEGMFALNAADGSLAWKQPEIKGCLVFMARGVVGDTEVVFSTSGDVIRLADGNVLWRQKLEAGGGPIFDNGVLYLSRYGYSDLLCADFRGVQGESFAPKVASSELRGAGGDGVYASPLYLDGLIYSVNSHGGLCVIDVKAKTLVYKQQLDLTPMFHYNACGVASSPTLGGKHIYVMDNQGNTVVFEPGRQFKQIARNQIQTCLVRDYPLNPQETTAYSNPVFEGNRLYIRGEQNLYCIGEK